MAAIVAGTRYDYAKPFAFQRPVKKKNASGDEAAVSTVTTDSSLKKYAPYIIIGVIVLGAWYFHYKKGKK
jgi:hypothetical protein